MEAEIVKVKKSEIQPVQLQIPVDAPLMTRMAMMMEAGINIDVDQMAKMQEISERHEANEARKAFHAAMALFKKDPPEIFKNKTVSYGTGDKATSYKHVTLAKLSTLLDKSLSKCDLSFTWKTEDLEKGLINVTCILTHKLGHSESASMSSLGDASGGKNPIQGKGSAVTYLQRYTLKAVTGVAEEGDDDDGAAAGKKSTGFKDPTKKEWECIDGILAKLPPKEGFTIDRTKLSLFFLRERGKYPSTKNRIDDAAEFVHKSGNEDMYVQKETEALA